MSTPPLSSNTPFYVYQDTPKPKIPERRSSDEFSEIMFTPDSDSKFKTPPQTRPTQAWTPLSSKEVVFHTAEQDVIIEGKNYGTPAQIKTRVNNIQTKMQNWNLTPRKSPSLSENINELQVSQEFIALYECLLELEEIPDETILTFAPEQRILLGFMINAYVSTMSNIKPQSNDEKKTYYKYEELYISINERISKMEFEDFFPPIKV